MRQRKERKINQEYAQCLQFLLKYYRFPVKVTNYGKNSSHMYLGALYMAPTPFPAEYIKFRVTFACSKLKSRYRPYLEDTFITQLKYAFGTEEQRAKYKLWHPIYG